MAALFLGVATAFAAPMPSVRWKVEAKSGADEGVFTLSYTGQIAPLYHIYGPEDSANPFEAELEGAEALSAPVPDREATLTDSRPAFESSVTFTQTVRAAGSAIKGTLHWQGCKGTECDFPETYDFSVDLPVTASEVKATPIGNPESQGAGGLWALILEAILWGFAMLLTPCVFPMVPMTVSFFLKGEGNGRFKAFMYGLFIVLLYTVCR